MSTIHLQHFLGFPVAVDYEFFLSIDAKYNCFFLDFKF